MKVCYLADGQSVHTQRWCRSVAIQGHEVVLLSFKPVEIAGVKVVTLWRPFRSSISRSASFLSRTFYLFGILQVRRIVKQEAPDILHGFYATSYGLLTALAGRLPYLISVWGSDVNLSSQNWLLRPLLKYALNNAKLIFCTSRALIKKTEELVSATPQLIHLPFGIELEQFTPSELLSRPYSDTVIIGTTKSLEHIYGIKYLIEAFAMCYEVNKDIRLHLVGTGSLEQELCKLVKEKKIDGVTRFFKDVNHTDIPARLEEMQIFVIPSQQESFGVAALEASAMGLPVVGSSVGGIPEVVVDGETGILVPPGDVVALTDALMKLILDQNLRAEMGRKGREFVAKEYIWSENVSRLLKEYTILLEA